MLQQAILQNNRGVHLLNVGDSHCAIQAFHLGYAVMKEIAQAILENETHPRSLLDADSWLSSFDQKSGTGLKLSGLEHGLCFVFDRPLLVDAAKVDSIELPAVSVTTILFNLGLACHQVGRLSGSEVPLRLASKYYNLVFRVTCRSNMDHGILDVLKCLALNNLAHLSMRVAIIEKVKVAWSVWLDILRKLDASTALPPTLSSPKLIAMKSS
jgi:hypothetical protein